ncbi:MAG TPA: alpha/beta fold hydrolase [Gemmataceae bacterium]|nr:alpha/beta fold hydrolase [Gemmataceae bacterium]
MFRCQFSVTNAVFLILAVAGISHWSLETGRTGDKNKLEAPARALVDLLAKEDYAAAGKNFDAAMKKALPPEKLKEVWQGLLESTGPFKKQGKVRMERVKKYDVVFVTIHFARADLDARIVFDSDGKIAGLFFSSSKSDVPYNAPDYVKKNKFSEIELKIDSPAGKLPASLSLPKGEGPFPALILVHGSGPHDRDESIGPNKPFRDLAWGLASKNIAVLRYEKRTKAFPVKDLDTFTVQEEVIDDAVAAVALLRKQDKIATDKIFVLGHSLGGTLAPRIGKQSPHVAGLILLAGASRPLEDLILEQVAYIISLDDRPSEKKKTELEKLKKKVAKVRDPDLSPKTPKEELPLGVAASYWLSLRGNPPAEARKFKGPILVLQGERDYQVTRDDFRGWKNALDKRRDVTFKSYPDLNHLFMAGKGKSRPEEYQKAGHVAAEVIDDIAAWIKKQ